MNKVILMGRLTRDPEVRYSQGASQTTVARYSIAVDRRFKREGEPDADFFNCTAFGKQAEFVERYLHKGIKILLSGYGSGGGYGNGGGYGGGNTPAGAGGAPAGDGFMNIPDGIDEELPF